MTSRIDEYLALFTHMTLNDPDLFATRAISLTSAYEKDNNGEQPKIEQVCEAWPCSRSSLYRARKLLRQEFKAGRLLHHVPDIRRIDWCKDVLSAIFHATADDLVDADIVYCPYCSTPLAEIDEGLFYPLNGVTSGERPIDPGRWHTYCQYCRRTIAFLYEPWYIPAILVYSDY